MNRCCLLVWTLTLIFFTSVLVHLPARIILDHLPLPPQIELSGISGTVWKGGVFEVTWNKTKMQRVHWWFDSTKLLTGNVEWQIQFEKERALHLEWDMSSILLVLLNCQDKQKSLSWNTGGVVTLHDGRTVSSLIVSFSCRDPQTLADKKVEDREVEKNTSY